MMRTVDCPHHEEENPGYLRVTAAFAGAHVLGALFVRQLRLKRQKTGHFGRF